MSRRPFVTAGLTTLLLFGALRAELDLRTAHVAVAGLHTPVAPLAPASAPPRQHPPSRHGLPALRRAAALPLRQRHPAGAATAPSSHPAPAAATVNRPAPARPAAKATTKPTTKPAPPSGTFTGSTVSTPYGNVQVQIKVDTGQITDVIALQLPNDNRRSKQISQDAGPQLRQEALDAQNANIDDVSGATYTSDAYKQSLQAAIDSAGLH